MRETETFMLGLDEMGELVVVVFVAICAAVFVVVRLEDWMHRPAAPSVSRRAGLDQAKVIREHTDGTSDRVLDDDETGL